MASGCGCYCMRLSKEESPRPAHIRLKPDPRSCARSQLVLLELAPQLKPREAADADVLAGLGDRLRHQLANCLRLVLEKRLQEQDDIPGVVGAALRDLVLAEVERVRACDVDGDRLGEVHEVVRAGDEV